MPADVPDRDGRVELVAAALCEAEWAHPSFWQLADESRRDLYRRDARRLLAKLDACAVAQYADFVTAFDIEAGLRAILRGDDKGEPGGGSACTRR